MALTRLRTIVLETTAKNSSDQSIGEETTNVLHYEGDNPKEALDVCAFGEDNYQKVFQLKGDAKNGLERVCGGWASSCTRTGHGEDSRARGPVGIYDAIHMVRKVDGILATHRTKEVAAAINAQSKGLQDVHLSILKGSLGYQATLKMVDQELGATGDDNTFAILGEWENLDGEDQDQIGWLHTTKGKISAQWKQLQAEHYRSIDSCQSPGKWTAGLITNLLSVTHSQWLY
jgi:hypothetical protein